MFNLSIKVVVDVPGGGERSKKWLVCSLAPCGGNVNASSPCGEGDFPLKTHIDASHERFLSRGHNRCS
jgi:hypothetical protein